MIVVSGQVKRETMAAGGTCACRGQRLSESAGMLVGRETELGVVVARGFAMSRPWLPVDADFALGNFIGDALAGRPIRVSGDGTPIRSFLHGSDVAAWFWTILLLGTAGRAYNVGSGSR